MTQRQHEALRAYLVEGCNAKQTAERFGYAPPTLYALARELRAGRLRFFQPSKPGPKKAPKREAAHDRVAELRKQHYSVYDIQEILRAENSTLSHVLVHQILREEGFAKLPRRRDDERPTVIRPEVAEVADVRQLGWEDFETPGSALFAGMNVVPRANGHQTPCAVRT